MRPVIAILLGCVLANSAGAQPFVSAGPCANGRCPIVAAPPTATDRSSGLPPASLQIDPRAIVRVVNERGTMRAVGTGTLVDADSQRGLIVTCAHLFRDGAGTLSATFPNQRTFEAQLAKIDTAADLAALVIKAPGVEPVAIAEAFPRRGDPLVSCGYGSDGQLWCNRGQALGYATVAGGQGTETLELTGAARMGDSGGPVFDRNHRLVAVLFGTNGRVVDGTYCGRVRRFLADLSPRFRARQAPSPVATPQPIPGPAAPSEPVVQVPPPPSASPPPAAPAATAPASPDLVAKSDQIVLRVNQAWQALGAKIDALAEAAAQARQSAEAKRGPSSGPLQSSAAEPPSVGSPATAADPLAKVAEPWLSAKLAALLVSLGVPGGIAGAAAGAVVWLLMRRAKQRLQTELDRVKAASTAAPATSQSSVSQSSGTAAAADPAVVERHHNRYVAYEVTALDKAWAAAHAHVGEKYPGAVPYLKIVEGVKDQLLSGNDDPQLS